MNNVYIVLTDTGSLFTRLIKRFTKHPYNHVSIAFDESLESLFSFGRKHPYNPFWGGFVRESISGGTFKRFKNTTCMVLRIGVEDKEYESLTQNIAFFEAHNLEINNMDFNGKYSFQYVTNLNISNSFLNTKDAFWHAQNVVVRDSTVKGEYLGWYSNNLTFINCKIIGTQPLCYCNNLKIIDCTMEDTDLSFEYSNVEASINGSILSVKNPKSGHIIADKIEEIILTPDTKYQCLAIIEERK